MNKPFGLFLLAGLLTASLAARAVMPVPKEGKELAPQPPKKAWEGLVHKVYTLQEQTMDKVNWVYLGYAPRVQDPNRVRVILSKQGFTMRVQFEMTAEEVADYPAYLKRRADGVESIMLMQEQTPAGHFINIKQIHKLMEFQDMVAAITESQPRGFEDGYYFLSRFFPKNIRRIRCSFDRGQICVEGNFVYPITNHRDGMVTLKNGGRMTKPMVQATPPAKVYTTQFLDERRSAHYEYDDTGYRTGEIADHLFNGFPAFWFKTAPGSKGVGVHGPIRYSYAGDKGGVVQSDYLNDPSGWIGINPLYRFEIVRTSNSEGCIRSQPMEMRHILPSNSNDVAKVKIHVINEIDMFDEDGDGRGDYYIDVDYYVENHYRKQDKRDWYLKHYISYEERQQAKLQGISVESVLDQKLARTKIFPYLHPQTYEFEYMRNGQKEDAPATMRRLNQIR